MILLFTLLAITFAGPLIDFGSNEDSPFWMPAGVYSVDVTSIDELSSSSLELQLAPEDASIDCRWAAHLNGAKLTSGTISSESPVVVSINCISINGVSDTLQIGTEGCFLGRFAETKPKQTTSQDLFQTRCSPDSRKRDVQEIDDVDQAGSGNPKLVIPQLDPKIYNPTANLTWLAQVISQFSPETLAEFASTFTKWVRVDYFFNYVNNGTHAVTQATGITIVEKLDPPQKNGLSIFKWQNNGSHILVTNGDKSKLYAATEQFSGHPRGFFEQWNNGTYIIKFDGKKTELVPIPEKGTQWHPWRSNGTHSFFWDGFKTVITLLDPKEQVDASIIRWWNNGTHVFQTVVTDKRGDEKTTISLAQKEAEDYIFGGEGFEYPVFRWLKNQTHVIFFNGSYTRAAPFPKDLDKKSLLLTGFTFQRVPSPQFHISFHTKNETGVFNIKYPSLEWSVSLLGPPKIVTWNGTAFVPAIPGQPITHHRGNFTWINNGTYTTVYNDVLGDFVFKNNNGTHTFLFNGTDVIIRPISDGQHTQPSKKWTNNGTHILLFDGFGRFITAVRTDNGTHKFTFDGRSFNAVIHGGDPKKPSLIWTETATEIRFYKPQQAKFPKNNGTHTFHWDGSKFVVTKNVIVDGIDGALDPAKIVSWSDNGTHTTQSDGTKTVIIPDFNGTHHFTFNGKFWIITPDDGKKTTFWTDNGTHYIFHETNGTQTVLKNNGTHSWHYDGKSWTLQTNQEVFVRNWYNNGTHITVFETGKPDVIVVINNGTHITSYDGTKFSWKKNDFNIPSNVASTNPVLLKPEFIRSWTNNGTHITVSDGVLKFVIVINNGTFSRSFNGVKWSVSKNQPIPSAAEAQVDPTLIHGVKSWKSNGTHVTLSDGTREWVIKVENATHHRAYTGVKWVITKIDNIQFTPEQANKDPTILKGIRGWSDNGTVTILTDGTRTWVIQNSNATHSRSFNGHTWTIKKHPNQFTQDVANHNPGIITGITSWRSDGVHVTVSDGIHTFVITINNGTHIREFDGRKWNIHTNGASHGNSTHPQAPPKAGNQTHPNGTSHPQAPKHPQAPPKAANHSNGTSHPQAPPKAGNQTHPNGTSHAPTHVPPKAGNQTHPNGTSHPQAPPKHPQAPPKAANQTHPNGTSHPQAPKHPQAPPKAANHSNVTVPTLAQVEKDPTIFKAIKSWHIAGNKLTISDGQHSFVIDIQNATHTRHWDGKKWLITKNAPKVPTVHHNNGTNNSSVGLLNASDVQRDPTLITHVESWNDDGTITTISNGKQVFVIQNNNGTHRRQWNGSKWVITAFKVLSGADANKDPTLIQGIVSWHDDGTTTTVSDGKNTYTIQDTNATHTRHYDGAKWTITALTPKANLRETTTEPQPEPQPEPVPEATSVHSVEDSPSSGGSSPWIIPAVVGGTVAIVIILVVILIFVVYKKKTRII